MTTSVKKRTYAELFIGGTATQGKDQWALRVKGAFGQTGLIFTVNNPL